MDLKQSDSAMVGEAGKYYDLDHLLLRKSHFAKDFEPGAEVCDSKSFFRGLYLKSLFIYIAQRNVDRD
jgi:hypothetical protein